MANPRFKVTVRGDKTIVEILDARDAVLDELLAYEDDKKTLRVSRDSIDRIRDRFDAPHCALIVGAAMESAQKRGLALYIPETPLVGEPEA